MLRIRPFAVPVLVVATLALAACATGATEADSAASPSPSATPEPSSSPSASPEPSATSDPWQRVEAPDGATWTMPSDWTATDTTSENEVGTVVGMDVQDETGATVLSYFHDLGGLGGIGGACSTQHPQEVLAATPSDAGLSSPDGVGFSDAAYAIEQPAGGVVLTIGVLPDSALDAQPNCLVYNVGSHPDGGMTSFATAFSSGVPAEGGAQQASAWSFPTFDDAQAYVDSDEGQTILLVAASLSLVG